MSNRRTGNDTHCENKLPPRSTIASFVCTSGDTSTLIRAIDTAYSRRPSGLRVRCQTAIPSASAANPYAIHAWLPV